MGSARSSPDSRWRRFLIVTAARKSDRSRIGAFLPDLFKVRYQCFFDISNIPNGIDCRIDPVLFCSSQCTYLQSSQFRTAIHDILGLEENDREFLRNVLLGRQLFCDISSTRRRRYRTVSVLQFSPCRAPRSRFLLNCVVRDRESIQS